MNDSRKEEMFYEALNGYGVTVLYFMHRFSLIILACFIITFNVFVMYALKRKSNSDDVTRVFIYSLSATDAFNGLFLLYNALYDLIHFKNIFECLFRFGFVNSISLCSTLQLLALSMDRYVKILSPYFYLRIFNVQSVWWLSYSVWAICGVVGFLPLMGWRKKEKHSFNFCSFFGVLSQSYFILYTMLHMISFFIIVAVYVHILKIAYNKISENKMFLQHALALAVTGDKKAQCHQNAPWWKPTKTVLIVIGIYFVCWTPTGEYIRF